VTVVLANLDGGAPDHAVVLLNTRSVDASDFITAPASTAFTTGDADLASVNYSSSNSSYGALLFHEQLIA
jgi:hypothetical protein